MGTTCFEIFWAIVATVIMLVGFMSWLFVAFPILAVGGYVPPLLPTPAAKTEIAITRATAFSYADKSKGGKVTVRCVTGLLPGEGCNKVRAELVAGDKRVPLTCPWPVEFGLKSGFTGTFHYTAHGVPPGAYRATISMSYTAKDGGERHATAVETVTVQ